ncbi:MAG: tRNA epoxyqueuosine(34) reductase QueG [Ignavibacteria bacterium]|jgi:epoxyqueuosine reductase|nr:tRNA epoxyqueuosine(34) reductase QueG [Ignavibacteria bacterium]MDH7528680.1 tRNA epoxyqueuosine(34) reductase QueG [Ignavibacteria bacterium]
MNKSEFTNLVRKRILEIGFDLVGFARADELKEEGEKLRKWLELGYQADMNWISKSFEKRINPQKILPEVKSIISVGLNYYQKNQFQKLPEGAGKISRYAWGRDYHKVIEKKFKLVKKLLEEIQPDSRNIFYVDYGPTMDKVWAIKSGLGWLGKHTNVINTQIGSWFFIGTILTTIEFEPDDQITDMCGDCRICIDACPTQAIVDDYVLDSRKCISYHTIENSGEIPLELTGKFENYVFGCDICQEVCPWNLKLQIETNEIEFASNTIEFIEKDELKILDEKNFKEKFKGKPVLRAGLKNLKRNFEFINQMKERSKV